LVEIKEDEGASVSPKVAAAMVTGVGRNGLATAAAIQIASGSLRDREEDDWGWAGSV
jgi:hypothetical protein